MNTLAGSIHFKGASAPNCGVTAIAIMTNTHFDKVWQIMQMDRNKNWKGRTADSDRVRALHILGFEQVREHFRGRFDLECFVNYIASLKPHVKFMVFTAGHVQVVHEGKVTDQTGTHWVGDDSHRDHEVKAIFTVRPLTTKPTNSALNAFMDSMGE